MRPRTTRKSFEKKVNLIEAWVAAGSVPDGVPIISSITQLQKWIDPAFSASSWGSFSVAAPNGPNADLRRRFDAILSSLIGLQMPSGVGRDDELRLLRSRVADLDTLVASLARQNDELLEQVARLKEGYPGGQHPI